jgi:hypothetical protein
MTNFVDYDQIATDIVSLVSTKVTGTLESLTDPKFKKVGRNLDSRDYHYANLPLCDVRMSAGLPEALAGQNYYVPITFELEMAAHSLRSQDEAATIILDLLNKTQRAFVENAHFSAAWDSIILGQFDMLTGEDTAQKNGAFMASVVAKVTINVYSQG